jgi:hypothetical protein
LHWETLLHVEVPLSPVPLVAVAQEDPFCDRRIEGDRIGLRVGHPVGILLILVHQHLEEAHDVLAVREGETLFRICLVTAEEFLEPSETGRPLRRVV